MSPSVAASIIMRGAQLDLLVLWRGAPGWYANGNHRGGGAGGNGREDWVVADYGDVHLDLSFDRQARTATVGGKSTPVPADDNVILVDEVDRTGQARVAGTARVAWSSGSDTTLADVFGTSSAVVSFLRCNVAAADDRLTALARSYACDDLAARGR